MFRIAAITCLLSVIVAPCADAQTTYHVDLGGSDTNDGLSFESARRTISSAVASAVPGDTILVNQGAYTETVAITGKPRLTVRGIGATILGVGNFETAVLIADSPGTRLSGFHIRNAQLGVQLTASAVQDQAVELSNLRISHCYFGVAVDGDARLTLRDCLLHDCGYCGVLVNGGSVLVQHATFALCWRGALIFGGRLAVKNSLFYKNSDYAYGVAGGVGESSYNAFFGNPAPSGLAGTIVADPRIQDEVARDFLLRPDSPLASASDPDDSFHAHIGAFGVGAVASAAPDPAVPFSDFHNWIDDEGRTVGALDGRFLLSLQGAVLLRSDLVSGSVRSPVHDAGSSGQFNAIRLTAREDPSPPSGSRHVIDADGFSLTREIEYRVSDAAFAPEAVDPPFASTFRNEPNRAAGRYIQVRLTFRRDGR